MLIRRKMLLTALMRGQLSIGAQNANQDHIRAKMPTIYFPWALYIVLT